MKKYTVELIFKTGLRSTFETDTDVRQFKPIPELGALIVTVPEGHGYHLPNPEECEIIVHENKNNYTGV
ncbi:hypothetical protein [Viridibacillus sp. FSL H8-0123]|uniref:hypothetical protein n=1 Tax=Viridibacillus sp. FSL H8-0123 TaxID=1928922 RepID=UPI00096D2721|nr:hypothetical protein [Viridibacillus sp. FSL H8-0123]OMC83376.1 hypothetical protein BK130_07475 [Viridibacillus sp. FSL H8-0123]